MEINELSKILIRFFEAAPDWAELALIATLALFGLALLFQFWAMTGETRRLRRTISDREAEITRLRQQGREMALQLDALAHVDLHVWERPLPPGSLPPRPAVMPEDGRTRFVAICNLKGGVGKTTTTANVGVGLALLGYRILLVDIDFQGTLSMRVGGPGAPMVAQRRLEGWTSSKLLDPATRAADVVAKTIRVSGADGCRVIVADHTLDVADFKREAEFYVLPDRDVRLRYRGLFFCPEILSEFDCVLFDCPPRLTSSCINALACSDTIILPTSLGQSESEALPRTFQWFKKLSHLVGHARKLVLLNAVYRHELTLAELQTLQTLETSIAPLRDPCDAILKSRILDRAEIRHAESTGLPAIIHDGPRGQLFGPLLAELVKELGLSAPGGIVRVPGGD